MVENPIYSISNLTTLSPAITADNSTEVILSDSTILRDIKSSKNGSEINEEQLYAVVLEKLLSSEKYYENSLNVYREQYRKNLESSPSLQIEDIANNSFNFATKNLSSQDRENLKAKAFRASQLDNNFSFLYDSKGSKSDPTIAKAEINEALKLSTKVLAEIDNLKFPLDIDNTNSTYGFNNYSVLNPKDGTSGFLWKPISDSNGKLVILLPSSFSAKSLELHRLLPPSEETLIERGKFSGIANGGRSHYRFSKAGSGYEKNIFVVAYDTVGRISSWRISDTAKRID